MIKVVVDKRIYCAVCDQPGPHPGDESDGFSDDFLIQEAREFGWFHILSSVEHQEQILCSEKCLRKYARSPSNYDLVQDDDYSGG